MIGIEEIRLAANDLTPGALKLYLYLIENVDDYVFWLSPKDVLSKYNMSKSTYDRAKQELIEKGYIVQEGREIHFYANKEDSSYSIKDKKKEISSALEKYSVIFGTEAAARKFKEVKEISIKYKDNQIAELKRAYSNFYKKLIDEIASKSKGQYNF